MFGEPAQVRCCLAARPGSALANLLRELVNVVGVSVRELAYLRLFNERLSCKTPQHLLIFEFMMQNGNHFTVEEIAAETQVYERFAELILKELAENKLIEKNGCLYRCNGIAMEEIIECE